MPTMEPTMKSRLGKFSKSSSKFVLRDVGALTVSIITKNNKYERKKMVSIVSNRRDNFKLNAHPDVISK